MIQINSDILDEVEVIEGTTKLIQVEFWEPNNTEWKYIIIATSHSNQVMEEWKFSSEDEATSTFSQLKQNVIT